MSDPTLLCVQLVKIYRGATEEVQAIRGVDLAVQPGTVTAILGPSGSGKSTLIRLVAGLDRPSAGSVIHHGTPITEMTSRQLRTWRRHNVAFVHQRPRTNLVEHFDVAKHLTLAAHHHKTPNFDTDQQLDAFGLGGLAGQPVDHLSGGEQQRLAIAAATIGSPPILIVDEPTAHQDDHNAALVVDQLRTNATRYGSTVLYTTHDPRITSHADRLLHLTHGALTSESDATGQTHHGVIDHIGRIQLPQEALDRFPSQRVTIEVEDDTVTLKPTDPQ